MTSPAGTPTAFLPVIRVARTIVGTDPRDYCARLAKGYVPHLDDAGLARRVAPMMEPPVLVVDATETLRALPRVVAAQLRTLAAQVDATARETFTLAPDDLVGSEVTVVGTAQPFPPGTVVWLRHGSHADLQFIFPRLVVDTATAQLEERSPVPEPRRAPPGMPIVRMADITVKTVAESAAEVASSVSWALPPPWNVAVTAGLSLLQIIMRSTDKPTASPYDELKKSFEQYIAGAKVAAVATRIRQFNEDLLLKTGAFDFDPGQLEAKAGSDALREFDKWWHGVAGTDALSKDIGSIIAALEQSTTLKDGGDILKVAVGGVTAWTVGQKVWMQLKAYQQQALAKAGNVPAAADKALSWRAFFDEINERLFDMSDPDSGEVVVQGWVSRISQWMDTKRVERGAQLHVVRTSQSHTVALPDGSAHIVELWGWRFVDDALAEKNPDTWAHFFPDTQEPVDKCHDKTVEHQDQATAAMNAEIAASDAITMAPTRTLKALRDRVTQVAELLPPKTPTRAVTVALKSAGTPTPAGPWKKGAKVSYRLAYSSHVDQSDPGPPTAAVEIGDFAGATLTNFPPIPDGASILISRTIQGDKPDDKVVRNVGFVLKGTTTFEDTRVK